MGQITAQQIIDKARIILQDADKTRWTDPELLSWLNAGQREICVYKPDAYVVNESVNLVPGTKQSLPVGGVTLISVMRNGANGAVKNIDRRILDEQIPNWHASNQVAGVTNFMFDPRDQKRYYVYPPAAPGASLEIIYAKTPAEIAIGATILVDDVFEPALMDYILFRAYSKDVDYAGDDGRAASHLGKFVSLLAGKDAGEAAAEAVAVIRRANSAVPQR